MEKGIVHEHKNHTGEETAEDDAECWHCKGVSGVGGPVEVPQCTESSVLHQNHQVVDEKTTPTQRHNEKQKDRKSEHTVGWKLGWWMDVFVHPALDIHLFFY